MLFVCFVCLLLFFSCLKNNNFLCVWIYGIFTKVENNKLQSSLSLSLSLSLSHTHTHTRTHARTHAHTHARTHARTQHTQIHRSNTNMPKHNHRSLNLAQSFSGESTNPEKVYNLDRALMGKKIQPTPLFHTLCNVPVFKYLPATMVRQQRRIEKSEQVYREKCSGRRHNWSSASTYCTWIMLCPCRLKTVTAFFVNHRRKILAKNMLGSVCSYVYKLQRNKGHQRFSYCMRLFRSLFV